MPTHNCETCGVKGNCPMESIAPWLNEHEDEVARAVEDCDEGISGVCATLAMHIPLVVVKPEAVKATAEISFIIGYHKGRTYQDVPQVFKDSMR